MRGACDYQNVASSTQVRLNLTSQPSLYHGFPTRVQVILHYAFHSALRPNTILYTAWNLSIKLFQMTQFVN